MPAYEFFCESCEAGFELVRPIRDCPGWEQPCPHCGQLAGRDLRSELPAVRPDISEYWSESLGKSPCGPGIPGEHYDPKGRIAIRSRAHQSKVAKLMGCERL